MTFSSTFSDPGHPLGRLHVKESNAPAALDNIFDISESSEPTKDGPGAEPSEAMSRKGKRAKAMSKRGTMPIPGVYDGSAPGVAAPMQGEVGDAGVDVSALAVVNPPESDDDEDAADIFDEPDSDSGWYSGEYFDEDIHRDFMGESPSQKNAMIAEELARVVTR